MARTRNPIGDLLPLPAGWNPQQDYTYILNQTDPIRIELNTQP